MHRLACVSVLLSWAAHLLLVPPARAALSDEESPADDDASEEVYRPITAGPLIAFTAPLTAPGELIAQPILYFTVARGDYDAVGRYRPQPGTESSRSAALYLYLEYGIIERLSAGLVVPVQHNWGRSDSDEASSTGLGDMLLFGRATLLHETVGGPPEIALMAQVKLPTGRAVSAKPHLLDTDVFGTGSTDLMLGLNLTKGARPFLLHADVFYTHALPARVGGEDIAYGDSLSWSVAGEWPFRNGTLALMLEASGIHQAASKRDGLLEEDGYADEVLVGAGIEFILNDNLQLLVGYQRTVWGRNASALDSVIVTLVPTLF